MLLSNCSKYSVHIVLKVEMKIHFSLVFKNHLNMEMFFFEDMNSIVFKCCQLIRTKTKHIQNKLTLVIVSDHTDDNIVNRVVANALCTLCTLYWPPQVWTWFFAFFSSFLYLWFSNRAGCVQDPTPLSYKHI